MFLKQTHGKQEAEKKTVSNVNEREKQQRRK